MDNANVVLNTCNEILKFLQTACSAQRAPYYLKAKIDGAKPDLAVVDDDEREEFLQYAKDVDKRLCQALDNPENDPMELLDKLVVNKAIVFHRDEGNNIIVDDISLPIIEYYLEEYEW